MHINADSVDVLADLYKQKYDKELIGKQMGQFHSDFTSMNGRSDVKYAIESYFISKKIYIDKLLMEDGTIDYMFRMKGVTTEAIKAEAEKRGGLMQLYKDIFEGKEVEFNLCKNKPCFDMRDDFTVVSRKDFNRKIKVN